MGTASRQNRKAEKAFDDYANRLGTALVRAQRMFDQMLEKGDDITSLSVRFPNEDGGDFLVTVRMTTDTDKVVGFHGATSFHEAVIGTLNRLSNASIKWRHDDYA